MAQNQKSYDNEFKAQAVKLAQEIGGHKAAIELGIRWNLMKSTHPLFFADMLRIRMMLKMCMSFEMEKS